MASGIEAARTQPASTVSVEGTSSAQQQALGHEHTADPPIEYNTTVASTWRLVAESIVLLGPLVERLGSLRLRATYVQVLGWEEEVRSGNLRLRAKFELLGS